MATETSNLTGGDLERGDDEKMEKTPIKKSVMEDLKSAKQQSSSSFQFARNFCGVIFGSVLWTVMVAIFNIIPITMIIIGAVYRDDCRLQHMIPIYLIVFGTLLLVRYLWTMCIRWSYQENRDEIKEKDTDTARICNVFIFFIDFFLIVWFIVGNVWIYGNYSKVLTNNHTSPHYCHGVLYYFAFWHTTLHYIILGLCVFCCPCIICYYYFNVQP